MSFEDDEQAGLNEREMPDESDMDADDETATVACPYCGKSVYEQAEVCDHCGSYISGEDAPRRKGWMLWGLILVAIAIVASWIIAR